jgi:hypothetical protein
MADEKKCPPKLTVAVRVDPEAWAIESDQGGSICEIRERYFMPGFAKRYADLFAASPELLEALELILMKSGPANLPGEWEAREQGRQAIAKARREQSHGG